ncbi:hypothetical protein LJR219_005046 [Phenylobacterium sp. LjRoot219]|uniref:hypothetical protein n=1 Tax=Phenylobacterium sp. LjRoot219 TaxID=3342283 RepID=UPI003ECE947D
MNFEFRVAEAAVEQAQGLAARYGRSLQDAPDDTDLAEPAEATPVLPTAVHIVYKGSAGDSARVVTLLSAWRTDEFVYFRGRCHLRRAVRTFRADKVLELICLVTGEAPDDAARWIAHHALFEGERTADYTPRALQNCRDELALMAFVGASDGVFDDDEVEVAIDYVMMSTEREIDRDRAAAYIRRLSPSIADLGDHLGALSRHPERWPTLTRAMRRLVDADRVMAVEEQTAWAEIDSRYQAEIDARAAEALPDLEELIAGGSIAVRFELGRPEVRDMVAAALKGRIEPSC